MSVRRVLGLPLSLRINREYRIQFNGPHFAVVTQRGSSCYEGDVREIGITWSGSYTPHPLNDRRTFRSMAFSWYMRWELCQIVSRMH